MGPKHMNCLTIYCLQLQTRTRNPADAASFGAFESVGYWFMVTRHALRVYMPIKDWFVETSGEGEVNHRLVSAPVAFFDIGGLSKKDNKSFFDVFIFELLRTLHSA